MHLFADTGLNGGSLENAYWGILIVTYPFISGLVAGSFVVSSLSHVFRLRHLDKLAPLAVVVSFAFLLAAPLTVLADARQPVNAFELFTRPHIPWSPLGDFTAIWLSYVVLMLFETYFAFRYANVERSMGAGWRAGLGRVLALGSTNLTHAGRQRDTKILVFLSSAGILLAFMFHGYIGFVFGAVKARAIWSTPLMPVLFIVSAIVSGIAFMYLVYVFTALFYRERPSRTITRSLLTWLMGFLLIDAYLDVVDLVTSGVSAYTQGPVSSGVSKVYLHGPHVVPYFGIQLGIGIAAPFLVWLVPRFRRSVLGGGLISLCVVVGVYAMRYNVVFGGQMESKVSQSIVHMSVPLTGFDSVQTVVGVFGVAFLLFLFFSWLLPWRQTAEAAQGIAEVEHEVVHAGVEMALVGDGLAGRKALAESTRMVIGEERSGE